MSFLVTVVVFDLGEILFFLLDGGGINTHYRRVMATTLSSLAPSAPKTSLLLVLVLFQVGGGSLLSGRGLFSTKRVSKGRVGRLILSIGVLVFLFSGPIPLETPWVHVANTRGRLQQRFCFCIDGFLNGLFPKVLVPISSV